MKLSLVLLTAVTASAAGVCVLCPSSGVAEAAAAPIAIARPAAVLDTVTLRIEGMTCGGCTLATRKVLERLDGVTSADVSYEKKQAVVIHDPAKVTIAQMIAAVGTLKYTATVTPK